MKYNPHEFKRVKGSRIKASLRLPSERRVYDGADGDEEQGDRVRFVEEFEGDVVDRPLVDAREAVGPSTKPVFLGMVDDGVGGGGGRLGVAFLQYYRHPSTMAQPRSITIGEHA